MSEYTQRETRAGYPTYGLAGPPLAGATTGRGGVGFDSSSQPQILDDAGNVLTSATANTFTVNGTLAAGGNATVAGNATVTGTLGVTGTTTLSGLLIASANTAVTAAGTVIANATALTKTVNWVNGADDTTGVILPTATPGTIVSIYSNHATAGLKIYPPVNGAINGGSANANVTQEGNTTSLFLCIANADYRTLVFTANA